MSIYSYSTTVQTTGDERRDKAAMEFAIKEAKSRLVQYIPEGKAGTLESETEQLKDQQSIMYRVRWIPGEN